MSPNVRLSDEQYQATLDMLADNEAGIALALALADFPRGRSQKFDIRVISLPHSIDIHIVHEWVLEPLHLVLVHEGDFAGALRACRATFNLGHSIGDEPCVTPQLIRMRVCRAAIRSLERLLGQGEVSEDGLAAFQPALAEEAAYDPWEIALRGERAQAFEILEALRRGQMTLSEFHYLMGRCSQCTRIEAIRRWIIAPDTCPDLVWALRYSNRLLETASLPWPQRRVAAEALLPELADAPELVSALFERVPKYPGWFQSAQAHSRCAVVALAAERYRLRHGVWPDSLAALVPDLLLAVPADPFDGQPLRYQRLPDGVAVYSIGENGGDDSGQVPNISPLPGTDLGFRLWDVSHRRQPPPEPPR